MLPLILATIMSLPIYPLNPTDQDTLAAQAIHFSLGVTGPSQTITAGPEFSLKYERLFDHPFLYRLSYDYRYGHMSSNVLPDGKIHRHTLGADWVYYRGTHKNTAYIGFGMVAGFASFKEDKETYDELNLPPGSSEVDIKWALGYRLTLGLRMNSVYSLEVVITEISPTFIYRNNLSSENFQIQKEEFRANDFKVSLGYLIEL